MTTYTVLARISGDPDSWKVAGNVEASSTESAIRHVAKNAGTYVAVPRWKPVSVSVETPAPRVIFK